MKMKGPRRFHILRGMRLQRRTSLPRDREMNASGCKSLPLLRLVLVEQNLMRKR